MCNICVADDTGVYVLCAHMYKVLLLLVPACDTMLTLLEHVLPEKLCP